MRLICPSGGSDAKNNHFSGFFIFLRFIRSCVIRLVNISSGDVQGLIAALKTASTNGEENTIFLESGVYNGLGSLSLGGPFALALIGEDPENTIIQGFTISIGAQGILTLEGLPVRGAQILGRYLTRGTLNLFNTRIGPNLSMGEGGGRHKEFRHRKK